MSEEPIRIKTAGDLFEVLSGGSLGARLAVLRDIQADPMRAVALGPHEGRDFLDFLIEKIPENQGPVKKLMTLCLMSFDDPRANTFLRDEFDRCKDAATALHLGQRLFLCHDVDFFRPFLWHSRQAQALAAARICCQSSALETRERLRIAVLIDADYEPPALSPESLADWLAELKGVHRLRVRQLAASRGRELLVLWGCWDSLPLEEKEWLLWQTAESAPEEATARLPELMEQESVTVSMVECALRLGVALPPSLLEHSLPEVRAVAISEGMADQNLESLLDTEASTPEVLAAMTRCQVDRLLPLLHDERWPVRSQALNLLALSHRRPLKGVREMARSSVLSTRVAAVELLLAWGDEEWLESNLIGSDPSGNP